MHRKSGEDTDICPAFHAETENLSQSPRAKDLVVVVVVVWGVGGNVVPDVRGAGHEIAVFEPIILQSIRNLHTAVRELLIIVESTPSSDWHREHLEDAGSVRENGVTTKGKVARGFTDIDPNNRLEPLSVYTPWSAWDRLESNGHAKRAPPRVSGEAPHLPRSTKLTRQIGTWKHFEADSVILQPN